jgi:hypothetical protein
MGIALSMISGGDVALLYDSHLAAGDEKPGATAVLGNAKLAAQIGATVGALLGGAVVTLSYGHLLWANALLSWIPVLLVRGVTEPPASPDPAKKRARAFKEMLSTTLVGDAATRLVFLSLVASGTGGLVMFWMNQKYWQESGVPLAYFGVLLAGYSLIFGFAGRFAALASARLASARCSPRPARCLSWHVSAWRPSSAGAGSCSGPWARPAGAWAGCSS